MEPQNYGHYLMKTDIKRKTDDFLVKPLKVVNRPGTQKLWEISHEMAIKRKKDEFLVITLKLEYHPGTPKLWAIAHENGHKTRK